MIKLKYGEVNNIHLIKAFQEVKKEKLPLPASYKFTKIANKIDQEVRAFQKEYQDFLLEYSEKDESGKPIVEKDEKGNIVGYKMADPEGANKVYAEMLSKEFTIEVNKVPASDLASVKISPDNLMFLEPFIDGLDAI